MKNFITITLFLISVSSLTTFGQHLVPSIGIEKNVAGVEYGTVLTYQTKRMLSFGAFYQATVKAASETGMQSKTFFGAVVNIPIARSERLNFYAQSRIGMVDQKFLAFVPGVETEMKLTGKVWLNIGAGLRMTHPSLTTKISFKL